MLEQDRSCRAARHHVLDADVAWKPAPGQLDGGRQPVKRGSLPHRFQLWRSRRPPVGQITAGRKPGMDGDQRDVVATRMTAR